MLVRTGPLVVLFREVCKTVVLILLRDRKLSRNLREVISIQRVELFRSRNQAKLESRHEREHLMRVAFRQLG